MPKLTGAHLFVRCLKMEGIEKVFTIVGDTILPLVDAAEDEGIQFIDARHEGAALHMADGYARITGKPGSGRITSLSFLTTSDSGVIQAKPFLPFMFRPSEPQTPSRHERL